MIRQILTAILALLLHSPAGAAEPAIAETATVGSLRLEFIGHASFRLTNGVGGQLVIDPFRNSPWSYWFEKRYPAQPADAVLVTHDHFDHNASDALSRRSLVLRGPGIHQIAGFRVAGIRGHHARAAQYGLEENTIYCIDSAGLRVCHWGDNDAEVTPELHQALGEVDILLVPVDESEHLLTLDEVDRIVAAVKPHVVVPIHYFQDGLTSPCSTLGSVEVWLPRYREVRHFGRTGVQLTRAELPPTQQVWVLAPKEGGVPRGGGLRHYLPCWLRGFGPWLVGATIALLVVVGGATMRGWKKRRATGERREEEAAGGDVLAQNVFENDSRIIGLFIDNAKTYVQLSSGALAVSVAFLRQIAGVDDDTVMAVDRWLVSSWALFVVAIGAGVFYQYLGAKYLEAQTRTSYERLAGLGHLIERPWPIYLAMMVAFYGGILSFVGVAIRSIS